MFKLQCDKKGCRCEISWHIHRLKFKMGCITTTFIYKIKVLPSNSAIVGMNYGNWRKILFKSKVRKFIITEGVENTET